MDAPPSSFEGFILDDESSLCCFEYAVVPSILSRSMRFHTTQGQMHSLLLPSLDKPSTQGLESLIPVIASMRSEAGHAFSVKFKSELVQQAIKKWVFFPSLVLLGSIHRGGMGGLVQHVYDSHLYRAAIYKNYRILDLQNYRRDKTIQMYYVTRLNQSYPEQRINKNAFDYVHKKLRVRIKERYES